MVKINGEEKDAAGKTIAAYLEEEGFDRKRIAVEINQEILPRSMYESRILKDGDTVEVVSFVGGG